jgi:hypothetical protein
MEQRGHPQLPLTLFRVSQLGIGMRVVAASAWQAVEVAKRASLFILPARWRVEQTEQPEWMEELPKSTCRVIRPIYPAIPHFTVLLVDLHACAKKFK